MIVKQLSAAVAHTQVFPQDKDMYFPKMLLYPNLYIFLQFLYYSAPLLPIKYILKFTMIRKGRLTTEEWEGNLIVYRLFPFFCLCVLAAALRLV